MALQGPVSIKDIARLAGVTHPTVSRALAGSPLVAEGTRQHIQQIAMEAGYSPNAGARSLVRGRTQTLGVVVSTVADPFVAEVVQGIEMAAASRQHTVILATCGSDARRELAAVEMLRSKRVDAIVVISSRVGDRHGEALARSGVPIVLVNDHSGVGIRHTRAVSVDNRHGSELAAAHLLGLGHRRIAHITGPAGHSSTADRLAGFRKALREAGVSTSEYHELPGWGTAEGGAAWAGELRGLDPMPTAVHCYNDMTALGLLRGLLERGIGVPGLISLTGFDDVPFARLAWPSLTTVAQPMQEMGRRAAQMALDQDQPEGDVLVHGELRVRESTGRPE